jgi:hypothetical protein
MPWKVTLSRLCGVLTSYHILQVLPVRYSFIPIAICFTLSIQGQFGPAQILLPAAEYPQLETLDMDGDGDLDLTGHFDGIGLRWAENMGSGTFVPFTDVFTPSQLGQYVFVDADNDGLPDIAYLHDNDLKLAHNLGAGAFAPPMMVEPNLPPIGDLASGHLNGDAFPEIVLTVADGPGSGLLVFFNENGNYDDETELSTEIEGLPPTVLLIGDMDNTGGNDIIYITEGGVAQGALNVNGDGSAWNSIVLFYLFDYPMADPQLIDIDADGDLDVAETSPIVVQWAENKIDENIPFNAFTVRVIESFMTAGPGAFGHIGCGQGAAMIHIPSNPDLPVSWTNYLQTIERFAPRQQLAGIPRGEQLLIADITGDGANDVVVADTTGILLFPNQVVAPTTVLELPQLDTVCVNGPSIALPEAIPAGGTWSGTWVMNGLFHRSSIGGTATVPLAYTYYEPQGCPVGAMTSMRVISGPTISPFLGAFVCSGTGPYLLTSQPEATEWQGLQPGNILDLDLYNGEQIVATYTDGTGVTCVSFMGPLQVWNSVPVGIQPVDPLCENDGIQTILPEISWPNNEWSGDIAGTSGEGALFDPSVGPGTYTVILQRTPSAPQQCADSDTLTIIVGAAPEVSVGDFPAYCASTSSIDLTSGLPEGGTWSGPGVSGDILLPFIAGAGTHTLTYTVEDAGCSSSAQTQIALLSVAEIGHQGPGGLEFCISDPPVQLTATPAGGIWSANVDPSGVFDPGVAGAGDHEISYTYTDPNGCEIMSPPTTINVGIESTPVLIDSVGPVCSDLDAFVLTGSHEGIWSGAISGIGDSAWFDPQVLGVGTWLVMLTADAEGFCPGTDSIEVVVEICNGIAGMDESMIGLAPNPATHMIILDLPSSSSASIMIFDPAGQIVFKGSSTAQQKVEVPVAFLAPGVYMVQVTLEEKLFHGRFVKQ